jgi:hypothetical protein
MDLNRFIFNTKRAIVENTGTILTFSSAALTVLSVVEAIRATNKAKDIIDDAEYEKFELMGCPEDESVDYHLSASEVFSHTWKCYIWTIILLSGAVTCGIASHVHANKKAQALSLAYGSLLETYNSYQDNVRKVLKDKDIREINHNVIHDTVTADKTVMSRAAKNSTFVVSEDTKVLFRDAYSAKGTGYFKMPMSEARTALGKFNKLLYTYEHATLNDWYDCLGIGHSELGDYMEFSWADHGPLYLKAIPDDIDIDEDSVVVTVLGLTSDEGCMFFTRPNIIK